MKYKVKMAEFSSLISEILRNGGEVTLTITGSSMMPMLRHRRDKVCLVKPQGTRLRKYDIPLYVRSDGTYVLHRIVDIRENGYVMAGDHQQIKEYGISHAQVQGVVRGFWRGTTYISCDQVGYRLYGKLWGSWFLLRRIYLTTEVVRRWLWGKR